MSKEKDTHSGMNVRSWESRVVMSASTSCSLLGLSRPHLETVCPSLEDPHTLAGNSLSLGGPAK